MENNTQCFLPKTSPCCFEQFADNSGKVDFCVVFSLVTSRSWSAPVKSHMVQKINKVYFFFFFAGRDLSYGLPSSLYRTLESSVFHGHCWVSFHCERYQSPASTSEWKPGHQKLPSGAGVFSCQGQREEKFPICVFVLMLSEKVSGAVTKYL